MENLNTILLEAAFESCVQEKFLYYLKKLESNARVKSRSLLQKIYQYIGLREIHLVYLDDDFDQAENPEEILECLESALGGIEIVKDTMFVRLFLKDTGISWKIFFDFSLRQLWPFNKWPKNGFDKIVDTYAKFIFSEILRRLIIKMINNKNISAKSRSIIRLFLTDAKKNYFSIFSNFIHNKRYSRILLRELENIEKNASKRLKDEDLFSKAYHVMKNFKDEEWNISDIKKEMGVE